jgi:DAACS family dicarboxylate/amino acid:cation (Na+ or H+) symporter
MERTERKGILSYWTGTPLYLRILGAIVLAVVVGLALGPRAASLEIPAQMILRLLAALAPPLILLAVVQTLLHAQIPRSKGARLVWLLLLNTVVAICIGLLVANVVKPGRWSRVETPTAEEAAARPDLVTQILDNVPRSLLGPLGDNGKVIGVIFIALAFGIALRQLKSGSVLPTASVEQLIEVLFRAVVIILHWIIEIIPLAVFGIVASKIGVQGFDAFIPLGVFVLAVILALLLHATYYLVRIRFWSWVRPWDAIRGTRDALVMAFSTASSTATMPVTYEALRTRVGLREESASLGALVGANFNNDGTALYEAMAALFVSQMLGMDLTLGQQLLVVLTSIVASVGAAGIPEAGLVTMTLVFEAVGLPKEYILILFTVDWFLDRCRTAINVMGDINVSCLLDGREPERPAPPASASSERLAPTGDGETKAHPQPSTVAE